MVRDAPLEQLGAQLARARPNLHGRKFVQLVRQDVEIVALQEIPDGLRGAFGGDGIAVAQTWRCWRCEEGDAEAAGAVREVSMRLEGVTA